MESQKYKIAIVDDHALFGKSLEQLINSFPHYETLYQLQNGRELQEKLQQEEVRPDLILLDINMPIMDGFETAQWLSETHPKLKFLCLTMEDDEAVILRMVGLGAKGYLLKDIHPEDLEKALDETIKKGYYHQEEIADILVQTLKRKPSGIKLRKNELTFLQYACTEMTYKQIAEQMSLSPKTIDGYRQEMFDRFEIKNRVGLVLFALKHDLVKL